MSEQETSLKTPEQATQKSRRSISLTLNVIGSLLLAVLVLWLYTLWANQYTPMTHFGRVNGQLIRITPQVSGMVASVSVVNNAEVKRNQPLLTIDKQSFELDVETARLNLQQTIQSADADSSSIEAAKASEVAARVKVSNAKQHAERNMALARRGVIGQATLNDSLAALNVAKAALSQAEAKLNQAEKELAPKDENIHHIKAALNRFDKALLHVSYTDIRAPAAGVITNMNVAAGDFASTGQPLMTFINNRHLWITAMVKESALIYLSKGTLVKVVLDAYPGRIFHGEITSIGWGSSGNGGLEIDSKSGLFTSPTNQQEPQRFPVNVRFFDLPKDTTLRYGGRATVSFYPGQSPIGEKLLDLWTWVWSYVKYIS